MNPESSVLRPIVAILLFTGLAAAVFIAVFSADNGKLSRNDSLLLAHSNALGTLAHPFTQAEKKLVLDAMSVLAGDLAKAFENACKGQSTPINDPTVEETVKNLLPDSCVVLFLSAGGKLVFAVAPPEVIAASNVIVSSYKKAPSDFFRHPALGNQPLAYASGSFGDSTAICLSTVAGTSKFSDGKARAQAEESAADYCRGVLKQGDRPSLIFKVGELLLKGESEVPAAVEEVFKTSGDQDGTIGGAIFQTHIQKRVLSHFPLVEAIVWEERLNPIALGVGLLALVALFTMLVLRVQPAAAGLETSVVAQQTETSDKGADSLVQKARDALERSLSPRAVFSADGRLLAASKGFSELLDDESLLRLSESLQKRSKEQRAGRHLKIETRDGCGMLAEVTVDGEFLLLSILNPLLGRDDLSLYRAFLAMDTAFSDDAFGVAILDSDGVFVFNNVPLNRFFGFDSDQRSFLCGLSMIDLLSFLVPSSLPKLLHSLREREDINGEFVEFPIGTRAGTYRLYIKHSDGEGTPFTLVVIADYTEPQRRMKELQSRVEGLQTELEMRNTMLGVVSHEIRNTMQLFIGETLGAIAEQDRQSPLARRMELLKDLVNDILEFSKLESESRGPNSVTFSPSELVEDLASLFSAKAEEKGLKFVARISPQVPSVVSADRSRIIQILMNIVTNSLKYVDIGYIALDMGYDSGRLTFRIEDSGIGMHPEQQKQVFDSFYRAGIEVKDATKGSGLGMAITSKLVELLGGTIELVSRPSKGTSVSVTIPVEEAEDSATGKANFDMIAAKLVLLGTKNPKVLVVDDDKTMLELNNVILRRLNVDFVTASSGSQALELLKDGDFNVVITDVVMPEMDGVELTRRISETYGNSILCILLTGADDELNDLPVKGVDVVHKPVDISFWKLMAPGSAEDTIVNGHIDPFVTQPELKDLLNEYRLNLAEVAARLPKLLDSENLEDLWREAHTLKGVAPSYGLELIGKVASELERTVKLRPESAREKAEDLRKAILATVKWLEERSA
ncbi:MAG: hypothetical protein Kow00107_02580 [Planctomycetota bacterium]